MKQIELSKSISPFQNRLSSISSLGRQNWLDILLIISLFVAAGLAVYIGANLINPAFSLDKETSDAWFHTDATRVFDDMAVYEADHYRLNLHPLFSLLILPPTLLIKTVFGLEAITAVQVVLALTASLWCSTLYFLLRGIGCRKLDATLFSILAATSAAAMFWFTIPESYSFGSLGILLALVFVAITQYYQMSQLWYVVVSASTLSITVTNWMVGILATIVNHNRRKSLLITFQAFCLVAVLVVVQKLIIPTANAGFLRLFSNVTGEKDDILIPPNSGPLEVVMKVVKAFVFDTMIMPDIYLDKNEAFPTWSRMSVEFSLPGSGSIWGYISVILWLALLSLGIWGFFTTKNNYKLRTILGITLLGQLSLHLLYGSDKAFLYTLHFLPLLVILAALSTLTKARVLALVLTSLLIVTGAINNGSQFNIAKDFSFGRGPLCDLPSAKCGVYKQPVTNTITQS